MWDVDACVVAKNPRVKDFRRAKGGKTLILNPRFAPFCIIQKLSKI